MVKVNSGLSQLALQMASETSTRLVDWVDYIAIPYSEADEQLLEGFGFELTRASDTYRLFEHLGAIFPGIVMSDYAHHENEVAIKIDSISDFLMVRGEQKKIEGTPFGGYRRCRYCSEGGVTLTLVERRGSRAIEPTHEEDSFILRYLSARELWKCRPRIHEDEDVLFQHTLGIAQEIVKKVGKEVGAAIVLEIEREYWQVRNRAAQVQKHRQDRMGLGWGNHDHHTFRSSRHHFCKLVRLFEIFGFYCRERFYAGQEAGWGAQVMENSRTGHVLFLDVDLAPEEIAIEFSHHELPVRHKLGTIGLWCGLHGDSIFQAGMHHLEAQFCFNALKESLSESNVEMMRPFSDFAYLKQAFTEGEIWKVEENRLKGLLARKEISQKEAEVFRKEGAIGSHLENLERNEGYKGFNQKNVSDIIQRTDPRHAEFATTR